jgi:hypothetical protein
MMLLGQESIRDVILFPQMKRNVNAVVENFQIAQYTFPMTAIAIELDKKLQSFDPETAASVEQLVRDALQLAEKKGAVASKESHREFIQRIAGSFGDEAFERPPQGEFEKREDW